MSGPHIMIVEARFYEDIADALFEGATAALEDAGATHERFEVPGAFELPAAIAFAHKADPGRFDGYVALGCVIRGETTHYDYVCAESARGLQDLAVREKLAIGYGVLTVENHGQAWARASVEHKNKGRDVANACLHMIGLRDRLNQSAK
ncbi:MAG: 6,7-dimethyl-8-ribityllumazine synthase [Alphaproteobacteria bacterium]|nr:6,7-dimethyl-8-ribityllumazine synthase [Alphaproteobacteria bacterium]